MGEPANRLIKEKSPYLLQHAFNPVDWFPWGEEAFAKAKAEDKPIFLSIGYSTCHWCHVMAHESFESVTIAEQLNKWFISVKVDREERPDIDAMYMAATQAMTGAGGWPMSVFLLPDGRPFYAATYIPDKAMYGRPGFPEILDAVNKAWNTKRQELEATAGKLINAIQPEEVAQNSKVEMDVVARAYKGMEELYDPKWKGFGKAPKFPRPVLFNFLLRYSRITGNEHALKMSLDTLRAMAKGGMYDQLGGGFHRYSVDGQWRVPHFEKMLYDQAQLANSYLDAYLITKDPFYSEIAADIFKYVLRDMHDPLGGFYSAEDADSEDPYDPDKHGEGSFFLWTEKDIVQTLGARKAEVFNFIYGVEFDGNALHDPQKEFVGRNILYVNHTVQEAADHFDLSLDQVESQLTAAREILLEKREHRKRPHLDDKVITAWNGLMISALARGGAILANPDLIIAAQAAADFIHSHLYDKKTNMLKRRYRDGEANIDGNLGDYAFLVDGLLELYQVVHLPKYLQWAVALTEKQIVLFGDEDQSGFYDSVADPSVVVRMKGDYDGAEPAANSVLVSNLLILADVVNRPEWRELASLTIEAFSSRINSYPPALPQMLIGYERAAAKPRQVVIAGEPDFKGTREMLKITNLHYDPDRVILLADNGTNQKYLGEKLSFIANIDVDPGKAVAFICENFTCRLPVEDVALLPSALEVELKTEKAGKEQEN